METLSQNNQDPSTVDESEESTPSSQSSGVSSGHSVQHAHHIHPHDEEDASSGHKVVKRSEKDALIKRMNRIAGQVNGVTKMIHEDRYCVDVLVQISAVKSALDGVAMHLLEDHTRHCVRGAIKSGGGDEAISELIDVIRKYTR